MGTGIDVCEIHRIRQVLQRHGERFLARVYTDAEIAYCRGRRHPEQGFAARFAAKEAAAKALGTGLAEGVGWLDLEVVSCENGPPALRLYGKAAELAAQRNVSAIHLSLSHGQETAVASVILESAARCDAAGLE